MSPAELRIRALGHALQLRTAGERVEEAFARAEKIVAWCLAGQPVADGSAGEPAAAESRAAAPQGRSGDVTKAVRPGRA